MKNLLRKILQILSKSKTVYRASRKIVDYHRNENNCEITENGELNFVITNKDAFDVIFDVGANIGEWTELISKTVPHAKIYSFEPSHLTFQTLANASETFRKDIKIENLGLGEVDGEKEFYSYGQDSTLSSAHQRTFDDAAAPTVEKVQFEKLDSYCQRNNIERISFLKIDTEGNELSVLKGAEKYLNEKRIDFIQFEYGGTYIDAKILLRDVFEFFQDKPYKIFKMMQDRLLEIPSYKEELENFQYANYIAKLVK